MDFRDRHVVVTGGTGALGTAVVGALIEAGAICHVPYVHAAEAERFTLRGHAQVKLVAGRRSCRRSGGRAAVRRRAEAVGLDPSRRRLRHEAGRPRPTQAPT